MFRSLATMQSTTMFVALAVVGASTVNPMLHQALRPLGIDDLPRCCFQAFLGFGPEYVRALQLMRKMDAPFDVAEVLRQMVPPLGSAVRGPLGKRLHAFVKNLYVSSGGLSLMLTLNQEKSDFISNHAFLGAFNHMETDAFKATRCNLQRWYLRVIKPNANITLAQVGVVESVSDTGWIRGTADRKVFVPPKYIIQELIDEEIRSLDEFELPGEQVEIEPLCDEPDEFIEAVSEFFTQKPPPREEPVISVLPTILPKPTMTMECNKDLVFSCSALPEATGVIEFLLGEFSLRALSISSEMANNVLFRHIYHRLFIPVDVFLRLSTLNLIGIDPGNDSFRALVAVDVDITEAHLSWYYEHLFALQGTHVVVGEWFQVVVLQIGDDQPVTVTTLTVARRREWLSHLHAQLITSCDSLVDKRVIAPNALSPIRFEFESTVIAPIEQHEIGGDGLPRQVLPLLYALLAGDVSLLGIPSARMVTLVTGTSSAELARVYEKVATGVFTVDRASFAQYFEGTSSSSSSGGLQYTSHTRRWFSALASVYAHKSIRELRLQQTEAGRIVAPVAVVQRIAREWIQTLTSTTTITTRVV